MSLSTLIELWDRFFFAKVSPYPVAAFRILQGFMYLQFVLSLAPDIYVWFGPRGIVTEETLYTDGVNKLNILSFFPNQEWLLAVWITSIIASILFTIGFQTRIASIVLFITIATFANRNGYLFNAGDTFSRTMSFWLMFVPTNEVWSVDSYLKNRKREAPYSPLISAWGFRALQIQMCIVYYSAFMAKTPGWYWAVGEATYIAARFETLQRLPLPFTFDSLLISQIFTWGTLIVEFSLFTLVWIKEFRYYVLACGICLHLTIDWVMSIPMFEWLMIVSFILFVYPTDLSNAVELIKCSLRSAFRIRGAPSKA